MTDLLRAIIAEVLRCSAEEIDPDRDLSLYGFDSLYVLRVVDQFKARTNRQLTPRIFFGCRTIRELVRKIGDQPSSDSVSPRSEKVLLPGPANGDHFANGPSNGERRTANGERELGNAARPVSRLGGSESIVVNPTIPSGGRTPTTCRLPSSGMSPSISRPCKRCWSK